MLGTNPAPPGGRVTPGWVTLLQPGYLGFAAQSFSFAEAESGCGAPPAHFGLAGLALQKAAFSCSCLVWPDGGGTSFFGGGAAFFFGGGAAFFLGGGAAFFFFGGGAAFFLDGGAALLLGGGADFVLDGDEDFLFEFDEDPFFDLCAMRISLWTRARACCLIAASSAAENLCDVCRAIFVVWPMPGVAGAARDKKSAAKATHMKRISVFALNTPRTDTQIPPTQ